MIPTIILILTYVGAVSFGWFQTRRLKDFLLIQGATSPDTAMFVDRSKYFVLTTNFPFSAIIEEVDGALWFDESKWTPMITYFGIAIFVTFITLVFLLISSF